MSFGADCLINKLNTNITGLGADNQTSLDFGQIGGALNSLENAMCCVATFNDLPAACDNEGRFIYVTSCRSFRYSDGSCWVANGSSNLNLSLFTWGCNQFGQLGDGTTTNRCSPGTVAGVVNTWCRVSSAGSHTLAIKTDGTLWSWGFNCTGQLGNGTTTSRSSPGTVAGAGTDWCQVSAESSHTAAIKTDGTLWTWGSNVCGILGDASGASRSSPGTVWGGGTTWCQVSIGRTHAAAIKCDGTLWTWGSNGYNYGGSCCMFGQLGTNCAVAYNRGTPGTTVGGGTNWCQVSNTAYNTAAIKCDGTLWTWGFNKYGQLGNGTTTNRSSPSTIAGGGTTWCQISIYRYQSAAVKTDGTLWAWGTNPGDGTLSNKSSPVTTAGGGTTWCQVSGSYSNMIAIKTDGTLWTWGGSELGDGTTTIRISPGTTAGGGSDWFRIGGNSAIKTRGF